MKFKLKKLFFIPIIIILAAIGYFVFIKKDKVDYVTAKVEKGRIVQTVSETGTLKAAKQIDLNFVANGKINKLAVKEGDKVKAEQILAELDYGDLANKEKEAQANLDKLLRGAAIEDVAVSQAGVNQAETAYASALDTLEKTRISVAENIAQAEKNLLDLTSIDSDTTFEQAVAVARTSLENTKSSSQKTIDNKRALIITTIESKITFGRTAIDGINTILNDNDAENLLSVKNLLYLDKTKASKEESSALITQAEQSLAVAKGNNSDANINKSVTDSITALNKIYSSLNYCYSALENSLTSSAFTQSELDTFKANVNTHQTNINTGISAIETAKQNLDVAILDFNNNLSASEKNLAQVQASLANALLTAKNNLATAKVSGTQQIAQAQATVNNNYESWQVAKAQHAKIKAPARSEDVTAAQASLDSIKKQIENSIIKAPIDGTVTKVNFEVGEQQNQSKPVISMLGINNLEIEVLISEADVAKLRLGNTAVITLDAFGDDMKFKGNVIFIEPAATVIQEVVYYKTDVQFVANEGDSAVNMEGLKEGMTANVAITTAEKGDILTIPSRAIIEKGDPSKEEVRKMVRVLKEERVEESPVVLGLRGDAGMVEIISGLKEGEEVIISIKEKKK